MFLLRGLHITELHVSLQERSQVKAEPRHKIAQRYGSKKGTLIEIMSVFLSAAPQSVPHTRRKREASRQMRQRSGNSSTFWHNRGEKKKEKVSLLKY